MSVFTPSTKKAFMPSSHLNVWLRIEISKWWYFFFSFSIAIVLSYLVYQKFDIHNPSLLSFSYFHFQLTYSFLFHRAFAIFLCTLSSFQSTKIETFTRLLVLDNVKNVYSKLTSTRKSTACVFRFVESNIPSKSFLAFLLLVEQVRRG